MKRKPDYTIKLSESEEIHLIFNNSTFRRFTDKQGRDLVDLGVDISKGGGIPLNHLPLLLFTAAEVYAEWNDEPFNRNVLEADDWFDALGGIKSVLVGEIYKVIYCNLLKVTPKEYDEMLKKVLSNEGEEKKSQTITASGSLGKSSKKKPTKRV